MKSFSIEPEAKLSRWNSRVTSLVLIAASLTLQAVALPPAGPSVKLSRQDGTLKIDINGQTFTTYHYADEFIYPAVRPFFWPVVASDGTEVTIDQAQFKDLHPYQRSIWVGHGDVNGADHWKFNAKPVQPRERHWKFDWMKHDGFQEELLWEDVKGEPMLTERRTVRFQSYPDGSRGILMTLRFKPVGGNVVFANHRDHGLLSARPVPSIAHSPQFLSAEGGSDCDGHTAWCDESGDINGKTYGIAIFDAPENPRHPPLWHAHKDARLATDIMQVPGAGKNDPARKVGGFTLAKGRTVAFRYEIIIHTGSGSHHDLAKKYADFVHHHSHP